MFGTEIELTTTETTAPASAALPPAALPPAAAAARPTTALREDTEPIPGHTPSCPRAMATTSLAQQMQQEAQKYAEQMHHLDTLLQSARTRRRAAWLRTRRVG